MQRHRQLILSGAAFAVLAVLVHFGISTERDRLASNLRTAVTQGGLVSVSRLESALNTNIFLANGLIAHIIAHDGRVDDTVGRALQALMQYSRYIRNIGIAPGNRISHVYPLQGNEAAIGLYYPDIPAQWTAVKRAMDTRSNVLAGPLALKQGGNGLVSRTPVFMPDGRYWGIISVALDADKLLGAVGQTEEVHGIQFAVRGKDGTGEAGEVFFGDPKLFDDKSIRFTVPVPGGTWVLAAAPIRGWDIAANHLIYLEIGGYALALLMAGALFGYQTGRQRIIDNEKRLRAFLDTTRDAVIVIDDMGLVLEFNPAAERLFGYQAQEMLGASINRLMSAEDAAAHDEHVAATKLELTRHMVTGREVYGVGKDGQKFPIEVTVGETVVAGRRLHVGVVRDISDRKAFENRLIELATTDSLTGALNRRAFVEGAEAAFKLACRHQRPLSFLMADADHFKQINDSFGHHIGDAVLIELTAVINRSLRATDSFGRVGGEEFAILLPETPLDHAQDVAQRLVEAVQQVEVHDEQGGLVRLTVSVGVASLSPDMTSVEALMKAADAALYCAKSGGRNRWCTAQLENS